MPLSTGLKASTEHRVADDDTAVAMASGDVPVLATPRLIAWVEAACVAALQGQLEPGMTTVGNAVQFEHVNPTPVGGLVTAEAVLETVRGRRLVFKVSAHDERMLIGAGRLTRFIVDRDRFVEKAKL